MLPEPAERPQIVAEDLHGDVRAGAGEHVIDAVRDRLTDRHVGARQCGKVTAERGEQLRTRPGGLAETDVNFCRLHALHMFVQLGASGSARRRDDLGLRQEDLFHAPSDLVGLCE